MDSQNLSDDVKLLYLKTLVAIAQISDSGAKYKDVLMKIERKSGQPQLVIGAYLEKQTNTETNPLYSPWLQGKSNHPLWKFSFFKEKKPTQRAESSEESEIFSRLQGNHMFRKKPKPKTCHKPEWKRT